MKVALGNVAKAATGRAKSEILKQAGPSVEKALQGLGKKFGF
jgi:hypothetical protein